MRKRFNQLVDSNEENRVVSDISRAVAILKQLALDPTMQQLMAGTEHRLEARILRGEVGLETAEGRKLLPVEGECPFQFPARWWPAGRPRYIDLMMRDGEIPWIVELKTGGSHGAYYREGIVQAALYREYIRWSPILDPWFAEKRLARQRCRALLVVEEMKGKPRPVDNHRDVAREFCVDYLELSQERVRGR